jgi:DMSO/TMAO reductase YedYZ molybdopterin-dependent catalytic subunit
VSDRSISRRAFLAGLALPLVACDSRRPRSGFLGAMESWNQRVQSTLLRSGHLARELPKESETAPDEFPRYFVAAAVPSAPPRWRLRVAGLVERPGWFSMDAIERLPRTDMRVRHYCVEGWSAVASWHGVRVRDLADAVGADPRAGFVEFRSFDVDAQGRAYYSSWDRTSALHPQTLLAYGMNGERLGPGHGAPLRLYSAVKLGYKMVKYLTEVHFLPRATGGYWEDLGYEWFAGV